MTRLKLRDTDVHWREIDGEVIALDGRTSTYVAANGSGAVIWRALIAGSTHEGLVDELVGTYDIDRERAAVDVDRFIDELAGHGLLAG
jgi:hypothetical protein